MVLFMSIINHFNYILFCARIYQKCNIGNSSFAVAVYYRDENSHWVKVILEELATGMVGKEVAVLRDVRSSRLMDLFDQAECSLLLRLVQFYSPSVGLCEPHQFGQTQVTRRLFALIANADID